MARSRYVKIQRQIGTTSYRGPGLGGVNSAMATSQVMTNALDTMSKYFFKKAGEKALQEGAEYGADNPITVAQIKESNFLGQSVTKDIDGDTIFDKSAKKVSLETLGNNLITQAKKQMSDLIINATLKDTNLTDVSSDLKGIVNEYVKLASDSDKILGSSVYAKLGVNSSAHYNAFSKVYAKRQIDLMQISGSLNLNSALKDMGIELQAVMNHENNNEQSITSKIYGEGLYDEKGNPLNEKNLEALKKQPGYANFERSNYMRVAVNHKYTKTMLESAHKDWTDKWLEARTSTIVSMTLEKKESSTYALNIQRNEKTKDAKIDAILNGMSDTERLKVSKAIITAKISQMNFEEKFQDNKDLTAESEINKLTVEIERSLGVGGDYDTIKLLIDKLEKVSPKTATPYYKDLDESKGNRTISDGKTLDSLKDLEALGMLEYNQLYAKKGDLNSDDFVMLMDKVDANEDKDVKIALSIIAEKMDFDPTVKILASQDTMFMERRIYIRIKGKVLNALRQAKIDKNAFDAVAIATNIFDIENVAIRDKLYENKLTSAKTSMKRFFEIYKDSMPGLTEDPSRENFLKFQGFLMNLQTDEGKKKAINTYRNPSYVTFDLTSITNILAEERLQ